MPLRLIADEVLEWHPIYFYEKTQRKVPINGSGKPMLNGSEIPLDKEGYPIDDTLGIDVAFFGLRYLSTDDMTRATNKIYQTKGRKQPVFQMGFATVEKILAACKKTKNVGDVDPNIETNFTLNILKNLPQWISEELLEKINEMNSLSEDDELD